MIHAGGVLPQLLAACPSFEADWSELKDSDSYVSDEGERLHYIDAGAFIRHLVQLRLGLLQGWLTSHVWGLPATEQSKIVKLRRDERRLEQEKENRYPKSGSSACSRRSRSSSNGGSPQQCHGCGTLLSTSGESRSPTTTNTAATRKAGAKGSRIRRPASVLHHIELCVRRSSCVAMTRNRRRGPQPTH
jgi:hypothetical protein